MSYDYNALVSKISASRRQAAQASSTEEKLQHLQESVDTLSTLSGHCPMTPLLWMQYSKDTADLLMCLSGEDDEEEDDDDGGGGNENASLAAASARDTRLQLLELALSEFPGSAILQLHYLQILCENESGDTASSSSFDKIESSLASALESVGKGSHRNEAVLVAAIYQLAIDFYTRRGKLTQALAKFIERAQTPMKDVNETLTAQLEEFCDQHSAEITAQQRQDAFRLLDEARRYESKTFNLLIPCEDEVDLAMHKEGILARHQVDLERLPWDTILRSDEKTCWMGYGGMLSAKAFIQYTQTCYRYRVPVRGKKSDLSEEEQQEIQNDEKTVKGLALCVYERGVAECPTAELLWLSYIRHLEYCAQADTSAFSRLKSVVDRAVRNCPYSLALFQQKLYLHGLLADHGVAILDPDELQKVVEEAIGSRFITSKEACLELYMTAMRVIRRRLLFLLVKAPVTGSGSPATLAYDEPESFVSFDKPPSYSDLDGSTTQELEDLCDDCRDFYETIDAYLKKSHASWSDGRGRLWSERAYMETSFLDPISISMGDEINAGMDAASRRFQQGTKTYDKLIKIHQPAPPDTFNEYIHYFQNSFPVIKPSSVMVRIRQTRFLYQKALKGLGRPKKPTEPLDPILQRDFDSGLSNFCHEYLVFERYFGSEKSLGAATTAIQKKLSKLSVQVAQPSNVVDATVANPQAEEGAHAMQVDVKPAEQDAAPVPTEKFSSGTAKRDLDDPNVEAEPPSKRAKKDEEEKTDEDCKHRAAVHKVKVGNLEHPAHPFTVRVLDLAPDVEDMDLIDTFRPKCGAIVHAKIMREKQHRHNANGKSKGWGLVQFELEESVEKALALSEVIGIHEKLVKVERSHMSAVGLVPPGMHRVNPKGEGRSSKMNKKRREARGIDAPKKESEIKQAPVAPSGQSKPRPSANGGMGILAFKPRGVQQNNTHRKVKVSLTSADQQDDKKS